MLFKGILNLICGYVCMASFPIDYNTCLFGRNGSQTYKIDVHFCPISPILVVEKNQMNFFNRVTSL